jgi:hypothetical protein
MALIVIRRKDRKELYKKKLKSIKPNGINAKKYCGKIELKKDPLIIQKEIRDEWE